jgi:hypothetical protein
MTIIHETKNIVSVYADRIVVTSPAVMGPPGPPGRDGDAQTSNTFIIAGDGLSGGGSIGSNVTISVDDSVLRSGTITVDDANSRVGINSLAPRVDLQIRDIGLGTYSANTSSMTPNQIIDSWSTSDFRSAKYHIQIYSPSEDSYSISELFLLHHAGEVYITEYAIVNTGNYLASYSASIFNGTVRLLCSPKNAINSIKVFRSTLKD